MVRIPTDRVPTHPGEMLLEEFLNPLNLTQARIGCRYSCSLSTGQRTGERSTWYYSEHSPSPGEIFRCVARVLAESPTSLGSVSCHPI